MKINCFLVARSVTVSPAGMVTITDCFDRVELTRKPGIPAHVVGQALWPSCTIVAFLEWREAEDGLAFDIALRFVGADEVAIHPDVVLPRWEAIPNPTGRPMRRPVIAPLQGVYFPSPGDYAVQLVVNGTVRASYEIYIDEREVADG